MLVCATHVSTYYKFSQYTLDNAPATTTTCANVCLSVSERHMPVRISSTGGVAVAATTTTTTSVPRTLPSASQNI